MKKYWFLKGFELNKSVLKFLNILNEKEIPGSDIKVDMNTDLGRKEYYVWYLHKEEIEYYEE